MVAHLVAGYRIMFTENNRRRVKGKLLWLLFLFFLPLTYAQQAHNDINTLLSSQGKVFYGDEPNSIMVIDYPENIQRVAEYLETMDIPPQQVLIEARVVEVKLQKEHALGVNWSAFMDKGYFPIGRFKTGTFTSLGGQPAPLKQNIAYKSTTYPPLQTSGTESPFTFAIFDDNISVVLQTLSTSLDTNILSAPRITTVNNRQAEIKITQSLPWAEPTVTVEGTSGTVSVSWEVNFEELGITLKVTPTINDDGRITMALSPEVSEKTSDYSLTVKQGATDVTYTIPVIDRRTASTKVVIGDGQTLIIGGLIKDKITKGATKIPLLGDMPLLGYLFKSKKDTQDKTELLIFVSPKIITPGEFVRMAKQERYGIGKEYLSERQRQEKMQQILEVKEEARAKSLASELDSLAKEKQALIEERKEIEASLLEEEKNIEDLRDAAKVISKETD